MGSARASSCMLVLHQKGHIVWELSAFLTAANHNSIDNILDLHKLFEQRGMRADNMLLPLHTDHEIRKFTE